MDISNLTQDYYYELPGELIAQFPAEERQNSRLLVLHKNDRRKEHKIFRDITRYISKGDCLVLNNTRVIPARLIGKKKDTGGKIEFVLMRRIAGDDWEVILKPGRRAKPGARFIFSEGLLEAEILKLVEQGNRIVRFYYKGIFEEILSKVGIIPLPPYIKSEMADKERYQTVYSKIDGSAAAPTAGLHFTRELLDLLVSRGVSIVYLTLHVGIGTFRPVKEKDLRDHKMHPEYFTIDALSADKINTARKNGGKIIAVGTTSCRVLETISDENGFVKAFSGSTDIYIYPGYTFKAVDAIITNFHLPCSSLIMLVSAFAGREAILEAYDTAIKERYRFFSFGDAMLII